MCEWGGSDSVVSEWVDQLGEERGGHGDPEHCKPQQHIAHTQHGADKNAKHTHSSVVFQAFST